MSTKRQNDIKITINFDNVKGLWMRKNKRIA